MIRFLLLISICAAYADGLGGFFGNEIDWKNYADGIHEIIEKHKPGMLVFHRDFCGACQRLGGEVSRNKELLETSKHFVMISCDGNEPESEAFLIDGNYYPRVFFVNPDNTMNYQFVSNPNNFQYRYYYRDSNQLNQRMKDFLHYLDSATQETEL